MRYMLLIYLNEQALDDMERAACYEESTELANRLRAAGQYVAASPLQPTSTATSVRLREGKRLITDGPFAETREQLGGYFLIDAKNLDEAIAIRDKIRAANRRECPGWEHRIRDSHGRQLRGHRPPPADVPRG